MGKTYHPHEDKIRFRLCSSCISQDDHYATEQETRFKLIKLLEHLIRNYK
jgi:protein-arginine kinase activator protein McsA